MPVLTPLYSLLQVSHYWTELLNLLRLARLFVGNSHYPFWKQQARNQWVHLYNWRRVWLREIRDTLKA